MLALLGLHSLPCVGTRHGGGHHEISNQISTTTTTRQGTHLHVITGIQAPPPRLPQTPTPNPSPIPNPQPYKPNPPLPRCSQRPHTRDPGTTPSASAAFIRWQSQRAAKGLRGKPFESRRVSRRRDGDMRINANCQTHNGGKSQSRSGSCGVAETPGISLHIHSQTWRAALFSRETHTRSPHTQFRHACRHPNDTHSFPLPRRRNLDDWDLLTGFEHNIPCTLRSHKHSLPHFRSHTLTRGSSSSSAPRR